MSETRTPKWTPGPYKVFTAPNHKIIGIGRADTAEGITDSGFGVWGGNSPEATATAYLLAAAPALYEALEYMADLFKDRAADQTTETGWYSDECHDVWQQARAALSLARGESAS